MLVGATHSSSLSSTGIPECFADEGSHCGQQRGRNWSGSKALFPLSCTSFIYSLPPPSIPCFCAFSSSIYSCTLKNRAQEFNLSIFFVSNSVYGFSCTQMSDDNPVSRNLFPSSILISVWDAHTTAINITYTLGCQILFIKIRTKSNYLGL